MATDSSGETPPAVAETAVDNSAPASAEARSLEAPSNDLGARVAAANSPAAVRALLSDARKGTLKETPAKPEGAVTPAPEAAAEPEAKPTEAAEETPAEAAEPEAAPAEEAEDDPNQDGPVTPSEAKKLRLRLREDDKVGRLAAAFQQRNRDMSLEEALQKAKAQLGIKPEATAAEPEKPKSDLPETVEVVDTTLESLEAEREKAMIELRFEDVTKIDRKMRVLDRHRLNLQREGEKKQTQAVQAYHAKFAESEAKAAELYPDAAKPDSEFGKRMSEIDADLEANGDPLFNDPSKPLRIAQMTAAEKNISPRRKGTPVAPVKPAAPPVVPGPKKGIVPSGASRTTPPPVNAQPAINAEVQAVKSVHDLRKLLKKVTAVPRQ
jgi:hypothetical protein